MNPALFIQSGDRLRSDHLPARCVDGFVADIGIDDAHGRLDHLAAIVGLCDDAVGAVLSVEGNRDARPIPQSARHIIEDLGVEFLAAEPGSFIFADDLLEKHWSQISPVVVSRAAGDRGRRVGDQFADDLDRLCEVCEGSVGWPRAAYMIGTLIKCPSILRPGRRLLGATS